MPDGSPEATVVWIETDGKYVYFNTAFPRLKARNLQRDPRVAITVFDPEHPYDEVLAIRGRAELIFEDPTRSEARHREGHPGTDSSAMIS